MIEQWEGFRDSIADRRAGNFRGCRRNETFVSVADVDPINDFAAGQYQKVIGSQLYAILA